MSHHRITRTRRPRARSLLAAAVCVLWIGSAAAQGLPQDLTQLPLEQLMSIDVVYGASRHEQKVTEAPSSVSVVTSDDIARYGYRTLADILRSVHGFYTTYDRNYTYLGVRGFSRPSDYNTRFLLLLDGHRMNDDFYGSAYVGTEGLIDVDLIDRVEIIRGPSSSLYGTSAFFAVVNVITRKPATYGGLHLTGIDASYGTPAGGATYARSFDGGSSFLASGSAYDSRGQALFYKEFDDPLNNNGVFDRGDYDRYRRLFTTATVKDFTFQIAYNSREKGIPTGAFSTPYNDPDSSTLDERRYFDVRYEHTLSSGIGLQSRVYYDRYYYRGVYPYYSPYPTILDYQEHSWGYWVGTESKLTLHPSKRQTLITGVEYRDNLEQRFLYKNVDPGPVDFDDRKGSGEGGLYVQDEVAVSKSTSLNVGLRRDQYDTFGGSSNPRAGLIYHAGEHTTLKALFGDAFRAPTVYELYYGSHANPDLSPEKIRTFEGVVEHYAHENLRLSGSVYKYLISDLVSVNTSTGLFENVDRVEAGGIEIEMDKTFRRGWNLRYSSTLQDTRDADSQRLLTNSPHHLAKIDLHFPIRGERLSAGLEAQYTSRRLNLSGEYTPSFTVVNLTLLSRQVAKGLEISASVYNLLDTTYFDPGSDHHVQDMLQQDGRNFRLKLSWGF